MMPVRQYSDLRRSWMNRFLVAALLAGVAVAIPGSLCAQPHEQGGHPGGGGHPAPAMHSPRPAMHAPTTHFRATTGHPTTHHHTHHVIMHHHHPITHVVHHHLVVHTHVVHHGHSRIVTKGHGNPRVASLRRNLRAAHRFHAGDY